MREAKRLFGARTENETVNLPYREYAGAASPGSIITPPRPRARDDEGRQEIAHTDER